MKRLAPLLAVSSLVLFAACSDDGDSNDDAASETEDTDAAATDDTEADETDGSIEGSDPDSEWCQVARDIKERNDAITEQQTLDAEQLEQAYGDFVDALDEVRDSAPEEIREDVRVAADASQEFFDALADVDFNILDLDPQGMEEITSDLEAAGERIDEYNERVCGIPNDEDDTATDDTTFDAEGTIREQIVEQLVSTGLSEEEAQCVVDNLDFSDPDIAEGDVGAMLDIFEECGVDLSDIGGG